MKSNFRIYLLALAASLFFLIPAKADIFHCCKTCQEFDGNKVDPASIVDACTKCGEQPISGPCDKTAQPAASSGINTGGKTADQLRSAAASQLNPAKFTAPTDLIRRVISLMMAFIGSIALVLFIWAGILWMTAAGEEKKIDSAKKIIVWTSLGVLVMLLSYTLVNFVIKAIK
ncbi:MAG: pilin [Patescibacteria group bacterium]